MSSASHFQVTATDRGLMSVPTLTEVASGDLVVFREGGGVSPYDPVLGPAAEVSNTQGSKTVMAPGAAPGAGYRLDYGTPAALLSNGTIVTAYSGDGTTTTTNINFRITNRAGAVVVPQTVVLAEAFRYVHSVHATATGFVILFSAGGPLKMAVYTNAGVQVLAPTSVLTDAQDTTTAYNVAARLLANGNIAIAYFKTTAGDCLLKVFDMTGAQVGATITVEAAASPEFNAVLQAPVSGDIVVVYIRTAGSIVQKVARYTLAGTLVGALRSFGGTGSQFYSERWAKHNAVVFSDDRVAVLHSDAGTAANAAISFLTAANALAVTVSTATLLGGSASNYVPMIASEGTSLYFHQQTGTSTYVAGSWRSDGAGLLPPATYANTALGGTAVNASQAYARLFALGATGFVAVFFGYDGASSWHSQALFMSADRGTSSVVTLHANGSVVGQGCVAIEIAEGVIQSVYNALSTAKPYTAIFSYHRAAIFGVAQAGAAAGALVSVATKGTYTLPAAQQGGAAVNFDCRAYTPAGAKGTLAGAAVMLLGLS